jgi:hypothetical protein
LAYLSPGYSEPDPILEFVGFLAIALAVAAYVWGIAIFFAMTFMPTYGSVEWWRVWSARLMALISPSGT